MPQPCLTLQVEEERRSVAGSEKEEEPEEEEEEEEEEEYDEEEEEEDDDRPPKKPRHGGFILDEAGMSPASECWAEAGLHLQFCSLNVLFFFPVLVNVNAIVVG